MTTENQNDSKAFYGRLFTVKSLLEGNVQYGHSPRRWNPKMEKYIYGIQGGMHIINLKLTAIHLEKALRILRDCASKGGKILFASTKKQAAGIVSKYAIECKQFYMEGRWPGGVLTNWKTFSTSISKLDKYDKMLESGENSALTKKEKLILKREYENLLKLLAGIRHMGGVPSMLFVIGNIETKTAIQEAKRMKIPIISIVDTNANPEGIDNIIPGNDDSRVAIELYCKLAKEAILEGLANPTSDSRRSSYPKRENFSNDKQRGEKVKKLRNSVVDPSKNLKPILEVAENAKVDTTEESSKKAE
ncbi:30S ribosomal protein S2 [Candidatus Fokinia solitaria]|uniref:Small ribosomal subunit protein uS2 n=1 Tax=Candidatus Fokinia solitaria TaxID=1802984 RepID=A0A2U8BS94_9RICK|nr:30S ribosomal protein S2 [Candidatus Fokinia solitaria]AWD33211.1 30S ribosomal protein S2 [Candidatus Fokinia solitaria]